MSNIARPFIPWVGGKEKLVPYVRQVFPDNVSQYLEPFGGGGAVLLSLPPNPKRLDIYNDLDSELVNLFLCVRERTNALLRELKFLPIHSRVTFERYRDFLKHKEVTMNNILSEMEVLNDRECFTEEQAAELMPIFKERMELYDVQRAAAFYNCIRGSFSGTMNSFGVKACDVERFLYLISAASVRLKDVVIENKNALDIIHERDRPNGLIYCDPPYYQSEKMYRVACKRNFHIRLWKKLSACRGYVVISYNDCPFIRQLYQDFYILAFERNNPLAQKKDAVYGELIITSFDPRPYMTSQFTLFAPDQESKQELRLVHIPEQEIRRKNNERI